MHNSLKRVNISRRKIASIPRQASEAQAYLTMYQNFVKKEHLEKELKNLERRYNEIKEHIALLNEEIKKYQISPKSELSNELDELSNEPSELSNEPKINKLTNKIPAPSKSKFTTITLGY